MDKTSLEAGYFGIKSGNLFFNQVNTGINRALDLSLMIYAQQYNEGADTAYLKAVSKVGKTVVYSLYNYTWHQKLAYDGQEMNVVVKRPVTENLTLAVKGGLGYRDSKSASDDLLGTDIRLFATYKF